MWHRCVCVCVCVGTYRTAGRLCAAVQAHRGAAVEGDQAPVQRLQRIVLEERMVLGHVTEVDGELQVCEMGVW